MVTASMAVAQVTVSGSGSMGVGYNEALKNTAVDETNLISRLNVDFNASVESSNGVMFGGFARYRHNQGDGAFGASSGRLSGARLHAATGPVTVQVGNISDAINALPGRNAGTDAIPTDNGDIAINTDYIFNSQGDGVVNGANLQYSMAGLSVYLSATGDDSNNAMDTEQIAGHVAYTMSGWTIAAGAMDADNGQDITALSVLGDVGFATVGGAFARNADAGLNNADVDKVRFHANIPVGAATSFIIWGADEDPNGANDGGSFGLELQHSLGEGVTAVGGYSNSAADLDVVSAEIQFSF